MPIRPDAGYPPDWPAISARIRHERARGRCECDGRCGARCHAGSPNDPRCSAENGHAHPVTGSTVVLTVAHLDHDPPNCADDNLAAMCQCCHLAYDAAARRAVRSAAAGRFAPDLDGVVRYKPDPDAPPCHLVRSPGDRHTVCGRKTRVAATCWVAFAKRHADGHGQVFCSICVAGLGPLAPKVPTAPPTERETPQ